MPNASKSTFGAGKTNADPRALKGSTTEVGKGKSSTLNPSVGKGEVGVPPPMQTQQEQEETTSVDSGDDIKIMFEDANSTSSSSSSGEFDLVKHKEKLHKES